MRYIKNYEELKTVKSSDLKDTWSPKNLLDKDQKPHIDVTIDEKRAFKVEELLERYGVKIISVGQGNFLTERKLLFNSEKDYIEHRVGLAKIITMNDYIESETNYKTLEELEDSDEYTEEEKEKIIKGYGDIKYDDDDDVKFSVFIPVNITSSVEKEQLALIQATDYLIMLSQHIPEVYEKCALDYMEALSDYGKGLGKILTQKGVQITNDNLDDASSMAYRIHKDSKFFSALEILIGRRTMEKLLSDWIKL